MIALPVESAKPMVHRHAFDNPGRLAVALAVDVANHLRAAIAKRGKASLIVSGGRSPVAFFEALAQADLPWQQIGISLADERWSDNDADRNDTLVHKHLLTGSARNAQFVPLKTAAAEPEAALTDRKDTLRFMTRPFDVIVLGMGDDGHTASLFPAADGLAAALDACAEPALVAITPPAVPHRRISFNLAACLDARHIAVQIQGASKREVLERAWTASPLELPIAAVLQQNRVPVDVYWTP